MPPAQLYTRRNVAVDISISSNTGVLAARYMSNQAVAYPPLRPLALVLKAYLRNQRLLDVATGGLSSYSLCNLIIAHLQEELKVRVMFGFARKRMLLSKQRVRQW